MNRKNWATKLAKRLTVLSKEECWKEQTQECCGYAVENMYIWQAPLASPAIEWFFTLSLLGDSLINVKVCYKLAGMGSYNHMNLLLPSQTDPYSILQTVYTLKDFALAAIEEGVKLKARETVHARSA